MRRLFRVSALPLALALWSCAAALGRAQQVEPSFRVSADLVVIDLVAVDREGRFIGDLRPDEVEVTDGRRRQAIQLLRRVGSPVSPGAQPPGTAVPAPDAVPRTPLPAAPDPRRLAIV